MKRYVAFLMAALMIFTSPASVLAGGYSVNAQTKGTKQAYNTGLMELEVIRVKKAGIEDELYESNLRIESAIKHSQKYNYDWDIYSSNYYYNQMNGEQRRVWDALDVMCAEYLYTGKNAIEQSAESYSLEWVKSTILSSEEMTDLYYMFKASNPQYYFLQPGMYLSSSSMGNYVAPLIYVAFANGAARMQATDAVKKQVSAWENVINSYTTEAEKVKVIHDMICNKVEYNHDVVANNFRDEETAFSQTAYSVFCTDLTVCAGYSQAFTMMCNGVGIDTVSVTSRGHQWNKVRVNDSWYNVDLTWSDGDMIDYSWFERSDAFYDNAEQAISHKEEDRWLSYLPACTLDTNPPNYYVPGTLPTISSTVQIPTVTLGSADNGCKVTLSCSTPNSIIYYTLDGTTPSAAFSRAFCYTGPFTVDKACTVKAMAVKDGHWDSEVRTYAVTADKIVIRPTAMYLNVETAKLEQGDSLQLKVSMEPATVTDKRITWKSSDTKVATVDSTGKVTVKGGGTTTVTAYATGKTTVKATCKITVPYKITYQLKGGKNNKKNPSTFYNKKITLKEPTRAKYEFLGWYSDSKYKKKVNSIPKTAKQNYTLYAKWQKVSVKKAALSSVKNAGNKKVVIKYKKVADAKGYEVSYALDRGFKKSLKTKTTNKLSYTVKGLKPGSTYYVRVRAYKLDSTGKKIYGKYSAVKKVKI